VTFGGDSKLRQIDEYAFEFCGSLKSICVPASAEVISKFCFFYCPSLRTVTFGGDSKLRRIGEFAFDGCGSLKSVSVSASVEVRGRQPAISVFGS
jgi:hypothetical protein